MQSSGVDARSTRAFAVLLVLCLGACAPALNWREAHIADSGGAVALFPCKPDRFARHVKLADADVVMVLMSCSSQGVTYAVAHAELPDPARAAQAMRQLRALAAGNVAGVARSLGAFSAPGMTPSPLAERVQIAGRRTDGRAVTEQAAFVVKGVRVFQVTALGENVDAEAVDTFLGGLRLPD